MSTSDQDQEQHRDQPRDRREGGPDDERTDEDRSTDTLIAEDAPASGTTAGGGAKPDTADEAAGEAVPDPAEADEARGEAEARAAEPVAARAGGGLAGAGAAKDRGVPADAALPEGGHGPDGSAAEGDSVEAVVPKGAATPAALERTDGSAAPEGKNETPAPDHADETAAPAGADEPDEADDPGDKRLTPRQARRLRILLSAVGMVVMAVVLALRIASRSSVLVVGVYGLALILCGAMIELSRNGRTRLASWLLAAGLLAAVGADWLLLP